MPRQQWTEENIRRIAATCSSRGELQKLSPSAYRRARQLKIIADIYPLNLRGGKRKWSIEKIKTEALKYKSRIEFYRGSGSAYNAAKELDILNELFGYVRKQHTEDSLLKSAEPYASRIEFARKKCSEYATSLRLGLIEQMFPNKHETTPSDKNVLYIWKAIGQFFNGETVYKIGITSKRLGDIRLRQVAKESGFDFEPFLLIYVPFDAHNLEKIIHGFGDDPCFTGFNGHSEFRALSEDHLTEILCLIGILGLSNEQC